MVNRITKKELLDEVGAWDGFIGRRVSLIACGGTAMTLLGVKDSTRDIDLMVPVKSEYEYLTGTLEDLGYKRVTGSGWSRGSGFVFDLFPGKKIDTTELIEDPLEEGNHIPIKSFSRIILGVLNDYDLIISKLFRGYPVDGEDCLALMRAKRDEIDIEKLTARYRETASYDISDDRLLKHFDSFLDRLRKEGVIP